MLLLPHFTLTFYPVAYPTATGGVVLQDRTNYVDAGGGLSAMMEQVVQRATYLRSEAIGLFVRGARSAPVEWTQIRLVDTPHDGLADALADLEAVSDQTGWLRIDLPNANRAFKIDPCVVRGARIDEDPLKGMIRMRWSLECGLITEIPGDYSDLGILLLETGYPLLVGPGTYLKL